MFRPTKDIFRCTVELAKEDMDSIVFALANKKAAMKISKEFNDLIHYCPDKKPGEKFGLPNQFMVMSELNGIVFIQALLVHIFTFKCLLQRLSLVPWTRKPSL